MVLLIGLTGRETIVAQSDLEEVAMVEVPRWQRWHIVGDWFDVCRWRVPCGGTFAQAPDEGQCDGILAWHVSEDSYGDVQLDGLNVVMVGSFEGNLWTRESTNFGRGFFVRARRRAPREALRTILGGQAGAGRLHCRAEVPVRSPRGPPPQRTRWRRSAFKWSWPGRSGKHFPLDWSGPDEA